MKKILPLYLQASIFLIAIPWTHIIYSLPSNIIVIPGLLLLLAISISYAIVFTLYYKKELYSHSLLSSIIASLGLKTLYTTGLSWGTFPLIKQHSLTYHIVQQILENSSFFRSNVLEYFDRYYQHPLIVINLSIAKALSRSPLQYIFAISGPFIGTFFGIVGIYLLVYGLTGSKRHAVLSTIILNSCIMFFNGFFLLYDRIGATYLALIVGLIIYISLKCKPDNVSKYSYIVPFILLGFGIATIHIIPSVLFIMVIILLLMVGFISNKAIKNVATIMVLVNIIWIAYISDLNIIRSIKLLNNILKYFGESSIPAVVYVYDPFYWFKYITYLSIGIMAILGLIGLLKTLTDPSESVLRAYILVTIMVAGFAIYTIGVNWTKMYTDYSIRFIFYVYFFASPYIVKGLDFILNKAVYKIFADLMLLAIMFIGFLGTAMGLHSYLYVRNYPIMSQEVINYPIENYYASRWISEHHTFERICIVGLKDTYIPDYFGMNNVSLVSNNPVQVYDRVQGVCYIMLLSNMDKLPYVWWRPSNIFKDSDKEFLYRYTIKIYDNGGIWVFKKWLSP